jgi:hypothetical protein
MVGRVQEHSVQLIGRPAQLALRGLADTEILEHVRVMGGETAALVELDIGGLLVIRAVQPVGLGLARIFDGPQLRHEQPRVIVQDCLGMGGVVGLDHPAEDDRILEGA